MTKEERKPMTAEQQEWLDEINARKPQDEEAFLAEMRKKYVKPGAKYLSDEEIKELFSDRPPSLSDKYPESNGGELAILQPDRRLLIFFSAVTDDGKRIPGYYALEPGTDDYKKAFTRHKFDHPQAAGKTSHDIVMQYFPGTDKPPIDLADEWK